MTTGKRYIVNWNSNDDGPHIKHEKVFSDPAEAQECVDYLNATGEVFNVTLKTERRRS